MPLAFMQEDCLVVSIKRVITHETDCMFENSCKLVGPFISAKRSSHINEMREIHEIGIYSCTEIHENTTRESTHESPKRSLTIPDILCN